MLWDGCLEGKLGGGGMILVFVGCDQKAKGNRNGEGLFGGQKKRLTSRRAFITRSERSRAVTEEAAGGNDQPGSMDSIPAVFLFFQKGSALEKYRSSLHQASRCRL